MPARAGPAMGIINNAAGSGRADAEPCAETMRPHRIFLAPVFDDGGNRPYVKKDR